MALSGSFYTNVGSHWRLQLEWSASQSISGNYSNVTARLYWIATDGYGAVNSSASKTCSITVDGSSSSKSGSGMAKLSGNQKKQIHSYTKRVNHNSDGTKSFSISAWFDAQVTLSGTYYNRISLSSRSFTLNTIPRASSITSTANWTAPNSKSVTISRASTSFTHTVQWQVKNKSGSWVNIKTVTGVGTSTSGSFTTSENTLIYQTLDGRSNAESRIALTTYSGSTKIGNTVYKTGTVWASTPSTLTYADNFNIGQNATFSIWRQNSSFKHTLKISFGSWSKTIASNFDTSTSWNTSNDASNLYSQIPNDNGGYGTYELTTYYNGVKVQYSRSYKVYLNVVNSNPSFDDSFTYRDINPTTSNITGNDQYIIQGKSNVRVTIPVANRATPKNFATMVRYEATLNGVTKSANWSSTADVNIDFGTVNASNNISLTIKAIDSRGNSTSASKTVTIIPYSSPTVNTTANRLNNFENQTTITLKGSVSPLSVGGANKNSIVTARYRYKNSKNSIYGSWSNFSVSGFPNYTASNVDLDLDNLSEWDIQVEVSDKLGTTTVTKTVPVGKPIFFIDVDKKSVGVNKLPENSNALEVEGDVALDGDVYVNGENISEGTWFRWAGGTRDRLPGGVAPLENLDYFAQTMYLAYYLGSGVVGARAVNGVIEYDANDNGCYIKFGDGGLICWHNSLNKTETLYLAGGQGVVYWGNEYKSYPHRFATKPAVVVLTQRDSGVQWSAIRNVDSIGVDMYLLSGLQGATGYLGYIAVGRWK